MTKYTNGTYPPPNGIVIVGEAPGEYELKSGKAFMGPSGYRLKGSLANVGLTFDECYMTNFWKHKPPSNIKDLTSAQRTQAQKELQEELTEICDDIRVIVPVGNIALGAFTDYNDSITLRRGSIYPCSWMDKWVIPTVHPAFVIRTMRAQYGYGSTKSKSFLPLFEADLVRIRDFDPITFKYPEREIITNPNVDEVETFIEELLSCNEPVALDIETLMPGPRVDCLGIGTSTKAMCIVFELSDGSSRFPLHEEIQVLRKLDILFRSKNVDLCAHNFPYDGFILGFMGFEFDLNFDTIVAQHCAYPELARTLHTVTSIYDTVPYYKEEGKNQPPGPQRWKYNCKDIHTTAHCVTELRKELKELGKLDYYYNFHLKLTKDYLHNLNMRGIRINLKKRINLLANYRTQMVDVSKKVHNGLKDVIGDEYSSTINLSSSTQIRHILYDIMKLPVQKDKKTGKPSSGKVALEALAASGNVPWLSDLLEYRRIEKMTTTYLGGAKKGTATDPDGYFRTEYALIPETDRLSSKGCAFKTGGNHQNLPVRHKDSKVIRTIFIPERGKVLISMDLVQVEAHIVMFAAKDETGMAFFQKNLDIHSATASAIYGLKYEEVGKHSKERYDAKRCVHALNYDMGRDTFAKTADIPINHATYLRHVYFDTLYKGLRGEYFPWIQECLHKNGSITNAWGWERDFYGDLKGSPQSVYREGYGHYAQSTAGTLLSKIYMRAVDVGLDVCMLIHDQIVCVVDPNDLKEAKRTLLDCNETVPVRGEDILIGMDFSAGDNFGELEDL